MKNKDFVLEVRVLGAYSVALLGIPIGRSFRPSRSRDESPRQSEGKGRARFVYRIHTWAESLINRGLVVAIARGSVRCALN